MASIDEILAKKREKSLQIKEQLDVVPVATRKKIERSGRDRPWRENIGFDAPIDINDTHSTGELTRLNTNETIHGLNEATKNETINLGQSPDKPRTELRSNLGQSPDKPRTTQNNLSELISETSDKLKTQPRTELRSNLGQSPDKPRTNVSFIGLVGLQREITLFIFETLKITLDKVTPPIAISHLAESCKTTVLSAQKTIQRLDAAGLIKRVSFKNGRSGWTRYSLDERIYGEMLQSESSDKLKTNLGQSSDKLKTQPRTQLRTSPPIVVVSSNFKNTTNTEPTNPDEPCFVIPNELTGKVSRRQLSEFVASGKITEYDLQLSLDAFAFDLRNKLVSIKHSSNPVGLLIGAIKNNGSYNSAKYIEALKSELKPLIDTQREFTAEKASIKTSPEWTQFLEFKQNNPEQHKKLEEKMANIGLNGVLLEDFTFLEYKKEVLKVGDETELNPLRPLESQSP